MNVLIVTAVAAEAEAVGNPDGACVIVGGVGRTNSASATTAALLQRGPFTAVINAGIAGILPGSDLVIGDILVADCCVYLEEGIETPTGFRDLDSMGFPLGDFPGNRVPVDPALLATLGPSYPTGPIATVATCAGTDAKAQEVTQRTGALAEAMEGASVVHAARLQGIPAIEVRSMSNTTGDQDAQTWDLEAALKALRGAVPEMLKRLVD
ncbi:MAG: futalosine hydrolase [Planctomycetota bacterium]|nr:futalosine hydrolase [Planctomycetota bacterium]